MRKIALESKELYQLWVDSSSAGVEEVDLERRDHTNVLRNIVFPWGLVIQPVGGS